VFDAAVRIKSFVLGGTLLGSACGDATEETDETDTMMDALTAARDGGDGLVGSLGPDEGLGVVVVARDELADRLLEFARAAMDSALDRPLGEQSKPPTLLLRNANSGH
jgi:hypothetical protein